MTYNKRRRRRSHTTSDIFTSTATFSVSVISSGSSTHLPDLATPSISQNSSSRSSPSSSAVADSDGVSHAPSGTNGLLLGIIVATLIVVAIVIVGIITLLAQRRRRRAQAAAEAGGEYPSKFPPDDAEEQQQLAEWITPFQVPPAILSESSGYAGSIVSFNLSAPPRPPVARTRLPPRGASLHGSAIRLAQETVSTSLPAHPRPATSIGNSRRTAYLNSQLEKLSTTPRQEVDAQTDNGSMVFNPLSSVPSETTVGNRLSMLDTPSYPRSSAPLPSVPEFGTYVPVDSESRGATYLTRQIAKLEQSGVGRRDGGGDSDEGSLMFSPLSRVPSDRTVRMARQSVITSPIYFRRSSMPTSDSDVLSPETPRPFVPPW
ncbi:hypothetical protein C8F01DRAFT_1369123 [Mycena amicta]|nr:hypothetical protein C8F01DRAFT_1369123 [Mycena amicta]